jgi:prophage antirepressor-like protein
MTVQIFEFGDNHVQVQVRSLIDKKSNFWFVAKDVATALGYADFDQAVRKNCKRQKQLKNIPVPQTDTSKELRDDLIMIPESDVFRLILRSKLESAEKFQDWVVEEVLPALRKKGYYVAFRVPDHQNPLKCGYTPTGEIAKMLCVSEAKLNQFIHQRLKFQEPAVDKAGLLYHKLTKDGKKYGILRPGYKVNGEARPGEIYWNDMAMNFIINEYDK